MSLSICPSKVVHEATLSTTIKAGSLLRELWAEVGSVDIGNVFEWLGVRKFWVVWRALLASNCVKEVENNTGIWAGRQVLQMACQVSALALEMTEDALRNASTYARRWASERCASERALRLSRIVNSLTRTTML